MWFKHIILNIPRLVGVLLIWHIQKTYVSSFAIEMWDIIAIKCLYAEKHSVFIQHKALCSMHIKY